VPPPPVPRPANERPNGESKPRTTADVDPREDPNDPDDPGVDDPETRPKVDPEAEAVRLLESALGARPISD
jgi:hypothetical protein